MTNIYAVAFTNAKLWAAVITTIGIIALGYGLAKAQVLKQSHMPIINNIVLKIALPALIISGFMSAISIEALIQQAIILGISFAFYIVLTSAAIIHGNVWYKLKIKKYYLSLNANLNLQKETTVNVLDKELLIKKRSKKLLFWMMLIYANTVFFGTPIILALYPQTENPVPILSANIWNLPYRLLMYTVGFMIASNMRFEKNNLKHSLKVSFINPVVIATILGFILWLTQLIPGASNFGENFAPGKSGWFDWGTTMPYFYGIIASLSAITTPLLLLSNGIAISSSPIKHALQDKHVWWFTFLKLILIPLVMLLIMWLLLDNQAISDKGIGLSMVIYAGTPPATVILAFAFQAKNNEVFASHISAVSSFLSVITLPLWIIICTATFAGF